MRTGAWCENKTCTAHPHTSRCYRPAGFGHGFAPASEAHAGLVSHPGARAAEATAMASCASMPPQPYGDADGPRNGEGSWRVAAGQFGLQWALAMAYACAPETRLKRRKRRRIRADAPWARKGSAGSMGMPGDCSLGFCSLHERACLCRRHLVVFTYLPTRREIRDNGRATSTQIPSASADFWVPWPRSSHVAKLRSSDVQDSTIAIAAINDAN